MPDYLRMIRILIILVASVLATAVTPATVATYAQTTAGASYLYRYANDLNGFIIERADGTEPRILARNLMKAQYAVHPVDDLPFRQFVIGSSEWSPSGNYLM